MIEIEIKARADHDATIKALKAAGAVFEKTADQADIFYNAPDRDFGKTDEALRLRRQGSAAYLTYKGKKLDTVSKTRKEIEVGVDSPEKIEEILLSLGFRKTYSVFKKRDIYHLKGAEVCVDRVDGLGDFVELETIVDDMAGMDKKRDELISLMRSLGIAGELIRESYLEMLLEKNHEQ